MRPSRVSSLSRSKATFQTLPPPKNEAYYRISANETKRKWSGVQREPESARKKALVRRDDFSLNERCRRFFRRLTEALPLFFSFPFSHPLTFFNNPPSLFFPSNSHRRTLRPPSSPVAPSGSPSSKKRRNSSRPSSPRRKPPSRRSST